MKSRQKKSTNDGHVSSTAATGHSFVFESCDADPSGDYECPSAVADVAVSPSSEFSLTMTSLSSVIEPIYESTSLASTSASANADDNSDSGQWQGRCQHGDKLEPEDAVRRLDSKYDLCGPVGGAPHQHSGPCTKMSDGEVDQIYTFFASYKTHVIVCPALANLYLSECGGDTSTWRLQYTGVPVLLVDCGGARSRADRRLQLVLAERGTGFMLWRVSIDDNSDYRVASSPDMSGQCFHTIEVSGEHRRLAGLSFDDSSAAGRFKESLEKAWSTVSSANAAVSASGKRRKEKSKAHVAPRKIEISMPCCFQHVAGVSGADVDDFFSVQSLVSQKR